MQERQTDNFTPASAANRKIVDLETTELQLEALTFQTESETRLITSIFN